MTQIVSQVEVVRVPELPELLAKPASSYVVIYNPADQKTYKILESLLTGGQSTVPNWTPSASFDIGELCIFNLKIWSSKTNANTGNTPVEGAFWEEVSKSLAGYTPLWAAGVFDIARSEVMVLDTGTDKYNLYILRAAAPFTSSNFATELAAGNWQLIGGTGGGGTFEVATNGDMDTGTNDTKGVTPLKFVYGITTRVFSALTTTAKTIQGAINELKSLITTLFDLKQRSNPSWDLSTVPTAADIVIDEVAKNITFGTINGAPLSVSNPAIYRVDQNDGTVKKYLVTTPQVFTYTATYGIWWIYFADAGGVITTSAAPQFGKMAPLLRFVYSTDENRINTRAAEFHPDTLSAVAHERAHAEGTVWIGGGDIVSNAITTGAPNADGRNTVISLTAVTNMDDNFKYTVQNSNAGGLWQQDLGTTVAASLTSLNSGIFNITYNQSVNGRLRVMAGSRFPFPWNGVNNRPQIISELGIISDVPNLSFFCSFIYALQDFKSGEAVRLRTSTVSFATIAEARNYSWDTLKSFSPTLGDNEIRVLAKCTWEVKTSWDASCKYAALREIQYLRQSPLTSISTAGGSTLASNVVLTPPAGYTSTDVQAFAGEVGAKTLKYHAQFAFTGIANFKVVYNRPVTITAFEKAADITDLRIGKNGATPVTLTVPYAIVVNDVIEFAATYQQDLNSYFTLTGNYTD